MISEEIRAQVREGRHRQGLPDHIEDPTALGRVAAILVDVDPYEPATPDTNGEPPPPQVPGEPEAPR
jgi:hypothetical protein